MIARKPYQLTDLATSALVVLAVNFFCNEMSVFANESFVKPYQEVGQIGDLNALGKGGIAPAGAQSLLLADNTTGPNAATTGALPAVSTLQLSVHGSMCPSCLLNLKKEIAALSGVKAVDVKAFALSDKQKEWRGSKTIALYQVQFEPRVISKAAIEARIKQLDFGISSSKIVN